MSRWWKVSNATHLMRRACDNAGGDVAAAIEILRGWSATKPDAKSAIEIIQRRVKDASRFRIARNGFVIAENEVGSIKRIVLGVEDSAVIDVLLDAEAENAAREAGLATEPDDEIVVEGRAGERLWDVYHECVERERAARGVETEAAKPAGNGGGDLNPRRRRRFEPLSA